MEKNLFSVKGSREYGERRTEKNARELGGKSNLKDVTPSTPNYRVEKSKSMPRAEIGD